MLRSRVITVDSYLELLGRSISALLRNPGAALQTIAESSFDAWIKYYRQDENAPNAIVSYYLKGSLVALALDLVLRTESDVTLDDVMRTLWQRYGRRAQAFLREVSRRSPVNCRGCRSMTSSRVTSMAPIRCRWSHFSRASAFASAVARRKAMPTRVAAPASPIGRERCWLGLKMSEGTDLRVQHVYSGGPACKAGLAPGDTIVAVDGLRANSGALQRAVESRMPGDTLELHVFRRDELQVLQVKLESAPLDRCWLEIDSRRKPGGCCTSRGLAG